MPEDDTFNRLRKFTFDKASIEWDILTSYFIPIGNRYSEDPEFCRQFKQRTGWDAHEFLREDEQMLFRCYLDVI